ncbi:uncharacterized protein BDV14DRAFT_184186 [Aspergillus stella-maris]|uniref:uncharacterized protein n=1 Tax=Aspergillus stella-maris TaxID=1810926 RepID=UPI003CCD6FF0
MMLARSARFSGPIQRSKSMADTFSRVGILSQALGRVLSQLTKEQNILGHGRCNHLHHHDQQDASSWFLQMDIWAQLELLRQLFCQWDPSKAPDEEALKDIDAVISYRNSHSLLTPSSSIPSHLAINNTRISLWKGDITTLSDVTAIVNAANSTLLGCFAPSHRCIDNVIHSAAGPELRMACYEIMQEQVYEEPVGHAKVTPGFCLPAKYVIHTVGPQLERGQSPSARHKEQLASCYIACLEAAEGLPALPDGRKVIVFCCISTGLFAFPSDVAANIALEAVTTWCVENLETSITDIIFDTFLEKDWGLYNEKLTTLINVGHNPNIRITPSAIPPQITPTASQALQKARTWLHNADYVIISGGAGLSSATGLDYTSHTLFGTHFPAFTKLGLNCLYDVFGYAGWKSPKQKWGYYFNHLRMVTEWPESQLYAKLLNIADRFGKRYFVRTSNADGFFAKNGFTPARISTPQGGYGFLQCFAKCRKEAVFPSAPFLDAAVPYLDPISQELTDKSKIPRCKYCGGELTLCVRGGDYFNDVSFRGQEGEYRRFVEHVSSTTNQGARESGTVEPKCVILELGVGMNTPAVLRWPDEELVEEGNGGFRLIRAGIGAAGCAPWDLEEAGLAVGINGDLNSIIELLGSS